MHHFKTNQRFLSAASCSTQDATIGEQERTGPALRIIQCNTTTGTDGPRRRSEGEQPEFGTARLLFVGSNAQQRAGPGDDVLAHIVDGARFSGSACGTARGRAPSNASSRHTENIGGDRDEDLGEKIPADDSRPAGKRRSGISAGHARGRRSWRRHGCGRGRRTWYLRRSVWRSLGSPDVSRRRTWRRRRVANGGPSTGHERRRSS
jgi:hypothetical protein